MRRTFALLAGSFAVYVLAAACGGGAGSGIVSAVLTPDAAPEAGGLPGAEGSVDAGGGVVALEASVGQPDTIAVPEDARATEAEATAPGTSGSTAGGDAGSRDVLAVPDARAEPQTSGTRLKARWLVGDDGSRQFSAWWDSKLGIECVYQDGGDGKRYCLPIGAPSTEYGEGGVKTPTGAPLAVVGKAACYDRKFVVTINRSTTGCIVAARVWMTGNAWNGPAMAQGGSISYDANKAPSQLYFYELGDPVPLSTFVSASVATDP